MKLTLLISSFAMTAAASSGTRRRVSSSATYEFGRPAAVDEDEVKETFREMTYSTMRMLGEGDISMPDYGMSMPDYGMSMPDYGMSMPDYSMSMPDYSMSMPDYSMSMPDYSMSMPDSSMSMSYTVPASSSSSDDGSLPCVPADVTNSPSGILTFTLEVEVLNNDAGFVGDLTRGLLNAAASELGVCLSDSASSSRRYLADASAILGLNVHESTTVVTSDSCVASYPGANCNVVYVVFQYYTNGEISDLEAAQMIFTALRERMSAEDALQTLFGNDNIVGLRVRSDQGDDGPENTFTETTTGNGENSENTVRSSETGSNAEGNTSRSGGGFTGTTQIVTLTMLSLVAVSAVAMLVYKKSRSSKMAHDDDDASSTLSRGDPMLEESLLMAPEAVCV